MPCLQLFSSWKSSKKAQGNIKPDSFSFSHYTYIGKFSNAAVGKSQSFLHNLKEALVMTLKISGGEEVVLKYRNNLFWGFSSTVGIQHIHWGSQVCTAAFIEFVHFNYNKEKLCGEVKGDVPLNTLAQSDSISCYFYILTCLCLLNSHIQNQV